MANLEYQWALDGTERVNKTAMLLARTRYSERLAPFVKNSAARLEYVRGQLDDLLYEVIEETGADSTYVFSRFDSYLKEAVDYKPDPDGIPSGKNAPNAEGLEDVEKTDVMDRGDVDGAGDEEARDIPKQDLGEYSQKATAYKTKEAGDVTDRATWKTCFRCPTKLNPVYAQTSPVCRVCATELKHKADLQGVDDLQRMNLQEEPYADLLPAPTDMPEQCTLCGQTGSHDELISHIQRDHQDVLQRDQGFDQGVAPDNFEQPVAAAEPADPAKVEPLPETPADRFDDMVQDLANRAAAQQFSTPDENALHSIASQLGVDSEQVQQSLIPVAIFGNYVGVNGQLSQDATPPEGYEEVSVQGLGGRVDSHEALVPTDLVISKVADDMNMEPELAMTMIRDRFGGVDLPDKYHASLSGEIHYYLPSELAGNQQAQQPDPNVGPTPGSGPTPMPQQAQQAQQVPQQPQF